MKNPAFLVWSLLLSLALWWYLEQPRDGSQVLVIVGFSMLLVYLVRQAIAFFRGRRP